MFLSDRLLPETIRYNSRAGRYTRNGQFVAEREIDALAIVEKNILSRKLEGLTNRLVNGNIDLPTWESEFARTLKDSHIRMTVLATGGRDRTGLNSYGIAGRHLKQEYGYLHNFAQQLFEGNLSPQQAIARSKLYAQSAVQTYYDAYHYNKIREDFKMAWRTLDLFAKHCNSCPKYRTNGFVPIRDIVPKGMGCECRGNCRCQIRYRRF